MQSKRSVYLMLILMCLVPGLIFTFFHSPNDNLGNGLPEALPDLRQRIVAGNDTYSIELLIAHPPLKEGNESFKLQITSKAHRPLDPKVRVVMPMGYETMEPPSTLTPLTTPNEYQVQTNFEMPGTWEVRVKPLPTEKEITASIKVVAAR